MAIDPVEQRLKALESFKDWSNYLLVTTVAALGWVSTKEVAYFSESWIRNTCIWSFAGSIFFAILTLALIPHIAELIDGNKSIYNVFWDGWRLKLELFYVCFPQHVLFLMGVLFYAYGTSHANFPSASPTPAPR